MALSDLLDDDGRALIDPVSQGCDVSRHKWGSLPGRTGPDVASAGESAYNEEFLALTLDLSAQDWDITKDHFQAATARTCDTAPRGGQLRDFGPSVGNSMPNVDVSFEGDTAAVRTPDRWPAASLTANSLVCQ